MGSEVIAPAGSMVEPTGTSTCDILVGDGVVSFNSSTLLLLGSRTYSDCDGSLASPRPPYKIEAIRTSATMPTPANKPNWLERALVVMASSLVLSVRARTVANVLGHAQASMTHNVYSHLLPHAACESADAMQEVLAGQKQLGFGLVTVKKQSPDTFRVTRRLLLQTNPLAGETGFEPATPGFGDRCSTVELLTYDRRLPRGAPARLS